MILQLAGCKVIISTRIGCKFKDVIFRKKIYYRIDEKNTLLLFLLINSTLIFAQRVKLKNTINYNAFGMQALPYDQLMVGGNHIFHKNLGLP